MPQIKSQQVEKAKPYVWIGGFIFLATFTLYEAIKDQLPDNPRAFSAVFIFGAFAFVMLCNGLLQIFGERKIKSAVLDISEDPISLGSEFEGWIHFPSDPRNAKDAKFFVSLKCISESFGGPGMKNKWRSEVVWQDDGVVKASPDVRGLLVPVNFWIPEDCVGSDTQNPTKRVLWLLEVYCSTRGLDFTANFPLNLQRTPSTLKARLKNIAARPVVKFSERDLTDTVVTQKPGEPKRLDMKPLRAAELNVSTGILGLMSITAAALLSVVGLKVTGTLTFLTTPLNALFTSFGIFLILLSLYNLLTSRSIKFMESSLLIKVKLLLFGPTREIRWSDIEKVDVRSSGTQGTKTWYDVTVKTRQGPTRVVARQIENKIEAEWIKQTIVNSRPQAIKKAA